MQIPLDVCFESFSYIAEVVKNSIAALDKTKLKEVIKVLVDAKKEKRTIIVTGMGRSLESLLLFKDCLEHNGFKSPIYPTSNANLRPWSKGDVLIMNSGSGSGSTYNNAKYAMEDGLKVLGMSYNSELEKEFPHILILKPSEQKNPKLAPLGTEFEFCSAVIGSCLGYSIGDNVSDSYKEFHIAIKYILDLFNKTIVSLQHERETIKKLIELISDYLDINNENKVYFCGVGRDRIINRVSAIRYGHLHKDNEYDLNVIYEDYWDLRRPEDLAIVFSGSGTTSQSLAYATQAFIAGMKVFGVTSFEYSDLGKFCERVNGSLVIPGRDSMFSQFNISSLKRKKYLPAFELNCYLTFDAILAQVAHIFSISEANMKASHRLKKLE